MFDRILRLIPTAVIITGTAISSFVLVNNTVLAVDQQPFTVTVKQIVYDPAGGVHKSETVVLAHRRDSSSVNTRSINRPDGSGVAEQRYVTDLAGGEEFMVDGLTESLTTTPLPANAIAFHKKPRECTNTSLGKEVVLGYDVSRSVTQHGGPGDIVRVEKWLAPALNCFPLKTSFLQGKSEADLRLVNAREALQVTVGEPAASLFEKPAGYVERSPSQRTAEYHRRFPEKAKSCPACIRDGDRQSDEVYYRKRNPAE